MFDDSFYLAPYRGPIGTIVPPKAKVKVSPLGPMLCSPADHLLPLIRRETNEFSRRDFINVAYDIDPYSPELAFLRAELSDDRKLKEEFLEFGIEKSRFLWEEYEQEGNALKWTWMGPRQVLCAMYELAKTYHETDPADDEDQRFLRSTCLLEDILELDPGDMLGAQALMDEIDAEREEYMESQRSMRLSA